MSALYIVPIRAGSLGRLRAELDMGINRQWFVFDIYTTSKLSTLRFVPCQHQAWPCSGCLIPLQRYH